LQVGQQRRYISTMSVQPVSRRNPRFWSLEHPRVSIPALAVYGASVFAANWMIRSWGTAVLPDGTHLVPVGFGLLAPSGVYAAGITFVARDVLQRMTGRFWSVVVTVPGALLTLSSTRAWWPHPPSPFCSPRSPTSRSSRLFS